jgi:hypothetical protein
MDTLTTRSYATIDKSTWGDGQWQDEPDKMQWVDEATDLDCLLVRNRMGALCGYVGVPPEHPWHGKDYGAKVIQGGGEWDGRIDGIIDVHGGLTYAASCDEGADEAKGICHVPLPGRSPEMWWFGFDCGHSFDIAPGYEARDRERGHAPLRFGGESYRSVHYVRNECAKLAQQLVAIEP